MTKLRTYTVWVVGNRISTETFVTAKTAQHARIKYAAHMGLKSYEVDAVWNRKTGQKKFNRTATR